MAPALERRAGIVVAVWATALGALALNRFLVGVFYDDGLYAGLAVSLASGGYSHPHLPGNPAAIHYPPVYPAVLAPLFALLSRDAAGLVAKILNILFSGAAAGVIAWHAVRVRLLGERVPAWLSAALVAAVAAAVPVLTMQSVLFAEPLFALLLALTVVCADRAVTASRRWAVAAGCLAALTLLTRTIGIAVGFGAVGFLALNAWRNGRAVRAANPGATPRSQPSLAHAIAAALPVGLAALGWFAWTMTHRAGIDPALAINYGSYGEVLKQTGLGALASSAADLPRPLFAITLAWPPRAIALASGVAAGAVSLYGLWLLARRSSVGLTLAGYCAILAIWPFPPDRFLWAVLPWLALVFGAGVADLLGRGWLRLPAVVVAAVALVGYSIYEVRGLPRRSWATQAAAISGNFTELLPVLRTLPDSSVLAVDNESLVWLYSGRRAVPLFLYGYDKATVTYPNPVDHRAYLERQGVTHVVLASASGPSAVQLRALIGAYPSWLRPAHRWPGGRGIFEVVR